MVEANIGYGAKLFKEILVMGTTSALEEAALKKRIENSPSEDVSLVNQLQEVKRVNQHFDSVLGQVQQLIDEDIGLLEIYDVLSSAIEEVRHFRDCYPVSLRDLIQYSTSLMLYNR